MKTFLLITFLLISACVQAQNQWVIYNTNNSGLPSNFVSSILIDSNNVKWITTTNGFVRLQGNSWMVFDTLNSGLTSNICGMVRKDKRNNIWLGCAGKGIVKYDGVNWTIYNNENTGYPINSTAVNAIDDCNNKWILGNGIFKFNDTNWVWYNTINSGLPTNSTLSAFVSNNIIWVGTYMGGAVRFDGENWTVYKTQNSGIPSNWIYMITSDTYNNLWFATFFGGLAKFNVSQNIWTVYNTSNSGLHDNNLFSVYIDNNSTKWIGGNGLAIYNDTTWQIFPYPFINDVFNFSKDRYGNMWICAAGGLYVYNPSGVVGVENNSSVISEKYLFIQNYPNPFNNETTIKYHVVRQGETSNNKKYVSLKIYDILGKETATLVNTNQDIGEYEVNFKGNILPSGVYFAVLKIDSKVKIHRLVLQK